MAEKALLAGINNYKWISDLRGCVNDVRTVERLLMEEYGLSFGSIRVVTDQEVTKERIEQEWRWLIDGAQSGDHLLFHFSGHGSYIADEDGDEDDGADELLCLYDMDFDDNRTFLLDDDLYQLTRNVPEGVGLTMTLDCCHSGTATRLLVSPDDSRSAADPRKVPLVDIQASLRRMQHHRNSRGLSLRDENAPLAIERVLFPQHPGDARETVLVRFVEPPAHVLRRIHRGGVRSGFHQPRANNARPMNHVLLAGSQSTQTSADAYIESDFYGAFSFYLCNELRRGRPRGDLQEVIRRVRRVLVDEGFTQIPQLEPENASGSFFASKPSSVPERREQGSEAESQEVLREIRDQLRRISELLSERQGRGS